MEEPRWMFRIPVIQKRYLVEGTILTENITLAAIGKQEVYVYHSEDFDFNAIDPANIIDYVTFFLFTADSPQNALAVFYAETNSWLSQYKLDRAVTLDARRPIIQFPFCSNLIVTEINPILFCLKHKHCDRAGDLEYSDCYLFCRNLQAQTWCLVAEFMEKVRRDKKRGKLEYEMVEGLRFIPYNP